MQNLITDYKKGSCVQNQKSFYAKFSLGWNCHFCIVEGFSRSCCLSVFYPGRQGVNFPSDMRIVIMIHMPNVQAGNSTEGARIRPYARIVLTHELRCGVSDVAAPHKPSHHPPGHCMLRCCQALLAGGQSRGTRWPWGESTKALPRVAFRHISTTSYPWGPTAKGWVSSACPALWGPDSKGQGATSQVHTAEESRMKPQLWGHTGASLCVLPWGTTRVTSWLMLQSLKTQQGGVQCRPDANPHEDY